jgi:DNA mismatch repair protein MutL
MPSVIHLLPEALANQIAAGEVVQRPASVVKELVENALDAGARKVQVTARDAGKALIQVIDDGSGMLPADARMALERHATSKIKSSDDLFRIATFGFRGEALASIAAVSQLTLLTRHTADAVGTEVQMDGGRLVHQRAATAPVGTAITVRNLFYNVPARRKFLKSNPVEMRHLLAEVTRVALAYPDIHFVLTHNDETVYDLPPTTLPQRLLQLLPHVSQADLLAVNEQTPFLTVQGYVGRPETARKLRGDQYLFVNRRYVRDAHLHHAIANSFQTIMAPGSHPVYVLFLTLDPTHVDVNIHPTKHEIKFDDERTVYTLVHTAVRRALGSYHGMTLPDAEANAEGLAPVFYGNAALTTADSLTLGQLRSRGMQPVQTSDLPPASFPDFASTFFAPTGPAPKPPEAVAPTLAAEPSALQILNNYIVVEQPGGLLVIDQHRAHQRILYEHLLAAHTHAAQPVQQLLYPQTLKLSAQDLLTLQAALPQLRTQGFDLHLMDGGGKQRSATLLISGVPFEMKHGEAEQVVQAVLADLADSGGNTPAADAIGAHIARSVARKAAIPTGKRLAAEEMNTLVRQLFACREPALAPDGQPAYWLLTRAELAARFGKSS